MSESNVVPIATDPFMDALVSVLMEHAAPSGAVDYPKAASAMATLLGEMIGPQDLPIRRAMIAEFNMNLERAVNLSSLRSTFPQGGRNGDA